MTDMGLWAKIPPDQAARLTRDFLASGCQHREEAPAPLPFVRQVAFDPKRHFGDGFTLVRDDRPAGAFTLAAIRGERLHFDSFMRGQEEPLDGEEKLARVHAFAAENSYVPLDASMGGMLVRQGDQIILRWLYATTGIEEFELPGTVLLRTDGKRFQPYLVRYESGLWRLMTKFVGGGRHVHDLAALYRP